MPIAIRPLTQSYVPKMKSDLTPRQWCLDQMRGKTIVFVSPGYPGKRFVFEQAHDMGVNVVIIDSHGSWTKTLEAEPVNARVFEIDMSLDEDAVFASCVGLLSSLPTVHGICTFVELSTPLTARLCKHFNLPGSSLDSVILARDKHLTRKAIASTPSTQNYAIRTYLLQSGNLAELTLAAEHVGFPAVLKPVSGAASLGVQKVSTFQELISTYTVINEIVSELVVSSGALERRVRMEDNHTTDDHSHSDSTVPVASLSNTRIVLEEYITGQEVDIDMVLCDGEITFSEISDNGPTMEPYFGETYNCCPSLLPESDLAALTEMAKRITVDALGFKSGVFHVEGKMSPNGPRLIEVNCRMGGGPIWSVHHVRSGVDLVCEQLLISAGLPAHPPQIPQGERLAIGFVDVNATKSGSINTLDFIQEYTNRPGMVYFKPFVSIGEHIVGPEEGQPSWMGEALFTRKCPHEAFRDARDLYHELQVAFEAHYV